MSVRVSIILPVFNAADQIEACLQSIASAETNTEVLLCDGGSTDETLTIARSVPHLNLRHIDTTGDTGIYDAMNRGIAEASGDYLYFMGADDRLVSAKALDAALSDTQAKLVIGKVRQEEPRHPLVPEWYAPRWDDSLILRNSVHHQGVLYHRSLFDTYRYPDHLKILADYHLNLWLYTTGVQATCVDVHIANCGSEGLSKRFTTELYLEEWRLKRELLPFAKRWWQPFWLVLKYLRKKSRS
jgi:glycosyltransferase involved in cell wall biosynthesis